MSYLQHAAKPEGTVGRMLLKRMNRGTHEALASWGLAFINIKENSSILDAGCGGGANIHRMVASFNPEKIYGIDYSDTSVSLSKEVNASHIDSGRCEIISGSILSTPFESKLFDMVTAFETIYFWPDIARCFEEVSRIIKPGGMFFICCETDDASPMPNDIRDEIKGMTIYSRSDIIRLLKASGFYNISYNTNNSTGWVCAIGYKPE